MGEYYKAPPTLVAWGTNIMIISLMFNVVTYWPGEKEEAEKFKKLGYTTVPYDTLDSMTTLLPTTKSHCLDANLDVEKG